MRSIIPILIALACPVGMCLVSMFFMRRGAPASCHRSVADVEEGARAPVPR